MKKKYQVFISSTYSDLIEERAAVAQCLLETDCIPVGMEQFPASNMSQMDYIKMMIDDCDYYVLILAGRYGSLDTDGVSFTEKEYNYAIEKGIPVMSFVIKDVEQLTNDKREETDESCQKLNAFRKKVCDRKLVKFYKDCGTLQAAVAISLHRCIQDFPAVGWVRSDNTETPVDVEAKIEKYMQEHTVSKADIEALFAEDTIIFDCGDANLHGSDAEKAQESCSDTVSLAGARAIVEGLTKRLPKVEWGDL